MTFMNHMNYGLEPLKGKHPEKTLELARQLDGLNWWVCAGTALGLYRDKGFIPHDVDVDIGIRLDWDDPQPDMILDDLILARSGVHQGRQMQRAFLDDQGILLDIYFYYTGVEKGKLMNFSDHGWWKLPEFDVKPLETPYGTYPFPHPIEDFLEERYGKDWRTPQDNKGIYL